MSKLGKIWKNKAQILEGIKNTVLKNEYVEEVFSERMEICKSCPLLDIHGDKCMVPGTQPCCSECGCSLDFKLRSLSAFCPKGYWLNKIEESEDNN